MELLFSTRSLFATALFVVLFLYLLLNYVLKPNHDKREPPFLPSSPPYVGHIINLIRHGQKYFETLCLTSSLPAFTLQALHKKVYILSSPALMTAAERAYKTVSFTPFVMAISPRLFDVGEREMSYIALNGDGKEGNWGLLPETSTGMYAAMASGSRGLREMIGDVVARFAGSLNALAEQGEEEKAERNGKAVQLGLFAWLRKEFAIATTDAIYGPTRNPFAKDRSLEEAFWTVEKDLVMLLFGPFPSVFARTAFNARRRLTKALRTYVEEAGCKDAGGVFRTRYEVGRKFGATSEDIARFELGNMVGLLINATPTLFWMILHVYSDGDLLRALRAEVESNMMRTEEGRGRGRRRVLDMNRVQDSCPLLLSTFREVLRFHFHSSTNRAVLEDTLLDDKYTLKKGGIVLMPGAPIHFNSEIWGQDAWAFNARRFLKKEKGEGKPPPAGAYRAWGGGTTICPGRFFATAEITCILAMVVARFDIEPMGREWIWPEPAWGIASALHRPKKDVDVTIRTRRKYVGDEWVYDYSNVNQE